MIKIDDITLMIAGKELLTGASCQISDGKKVGVIGDNGCGKSTLFKAILGQIPPFLGEIQIPKDAVIATVEQEIADTGVPILQFVLNKDRALKYYREKLQTATDAELVEIHEHLRRLGSDSAESRVAAILHGLGFAQEDFSRPIHDFSGGWRMRLTLAGALFQNSDILLLDEPSNHLDWEAVIWLENYLKKYRGTLLLISHDKEFLDNNCEEILNFENKKLVLYHGNYHTFQKNFALKNENLKKQIQKDNEKRAHLQSYIDRFRYKASKAKQAQSRIKMLEKMGQNPELLPESKDVFNFPKAEELAPPYIRLENVSVGYGDAPVLTKLNLMIADNERIALLGRNGNGKSTLAKLLAGELKPMSGTLFKSAKLKVGFFNQHQNESLPADETPVSFMSALMPEQTEAQIRSYLAQFGLEAEKAITMIDKLSGGEKVRLVLGKICLAKPHLLLLDEPTNHLDLKGREALIEALNQYNGSVILITHDFHILQCVCDTLWIVQNKTCKKFDGDLEDYRKILLDEKPAEKPKNKVELAAPKAKKISKSSLYFKMKKVEETLAKLDAEQKETEAKIAAGGADTDYKSLNRRLNEILEETKEQESLWDTYAEQM